MIILYILFGIIATLILLLCLPVNIRILYDYPIAKWNQKPLNEQAVEEENEYVPLTDDPELLAVVDYLKSNDLWPKPPPLPPEPELTVKIHCLFFHFTLFPRPYKEKKKETEIMEEKTKEKEAKEKEETSSLEKLEDIIAFVKKVLPKVKRLVTSIANNIRFHHIRLEAEISAENSVETTKKFVHLNQALYGFLTVAQNYVTIRFSEIRIVPDFYAEHNNFVGELRVGFNPIVIVGALLRFACSMLLLLLHKEKSVPDPKSKPKDTSKTQPQKAGN